MVPLIFFPFACSDRTGMEPNDYVSLLFVSLFGRSIFWNGTVLIEVFQCERNPSALHFSEQYGTKWNDCVYL